MEASILKLSVEPGAPPTLHATGELNFQNCEELHRLIRETMETDGPAVSLSLCGLDFVDSSGLRILLTTARDAMKKSGRLRIVSTTSHIRHMLTVSGLDSLFEIDPYMPVEEAPEAAAPISDKSCCVDMPPEVSSCREARAAVCGFAAGAGCAPDTVDDVGLALGEAVSNAIRHGTRTGTIRIRAKKENDRLVVRVRYPSSAFDPESVPKPDLESKPSGGMGIYFMRLVMNEVNYHFEDNHATVELVKWHEAPQ
ncbi:MAG: anti-sigma factor antagonist [Armatimonadetes bacterium]|nr:anti-sigma factor antagonist [Armatimonadota bacterium]